MAHTRRGVLVSSILTLTAAGCGPEDSESPDEGPSRSSLTPYETSSSPTAFAVDAGVVPGHPGMPGAGWLDVARSPLKPYCSAVQVDADTVLTSASCAHRTASMTFGQGPVGTGGREVIDVAGHPASPKLAALTLEPSTHGVSAEVKELATESDELDGEQVHGVSYMFVRREEPSSSWTWTGTLDTTGGRLAVELDGNPATEGGANCHGDNGAGVYTDSGDLVGIVVGASRSGDDVCVTRLTLARP